MLEILADRLAEGGRLFRIDQRVRIGTHGIAAPHQLAGLKVIGAYPGAHAEFAAGDADEHFVLEDHGRGCAGLALRGIAVLHRPDDRAALRVQRDERRVRLMQQYLAVGVGEAAVDRVAAHHRDDVGILLGLIFPENLAVVVEVEREDGVREWRMDIHHVANNERRSFVTTQNPGRECPGRRELVDIFSVDLLEFRVPRIGVVSGRHHPLIGVGRHFHQFFVRGGVPGREQGRNAKAACKQKFAHSFLPVSMPSKARLSTLCVYARFAATVSVGTASTACHDRAKQAGSLSRGISPCLRKACRGSRSSTLVQPKPRK